MEMSRPRNTERFDALHSLLSFGMITACVEERGGFYCFLTDFSSSFIVGLVSEIFNLYLEIFT